MLLKDLNCFKLSQKFAASILLFHASFLMKRKCRASFHSSETRESNKLKYMQKLLFSAKMTGLGLL